MGEKLHNTLSENDKGIIEKCKESAYSNTKRRHQKKLSDLLNKARKKKVSNLRPEGLDSNYLSYSRCFYVSNVNSVVCNAHMHSLHTLQGEDIVANYTLVLYRPTIG